MLCAQVSPERLGAKVPELGAGAAPKDALQTLLNLDIRKFGEGAVPEGLGRTERGELAGPALLQLLKIVNVTEPSISQDTMGTSAPCRACWLPHNAPPEERAGERAWH